MTPTTDRSDREAEVRRAEADWTRAHLELDLDTIDRLLAAEYIQISSDGGGPAG